MKQLKTILKILVSLASVVFLIWFLPQVKNLFCQIGVGLCLGIFLGSMHESYVHQYLGHAKTKTREFWRRHPRIFLPLIEGFFLHHIVHHGKTYREGYQEQFGEALSAETVDAWAPEVFYRLFDAKDQAWARKALPPEKLVQHVRKSAYGKGADSVIDFAKTTFPLVAILFLVAPFWMAVSAALPILIGYPAMSNTIHRNMMHVSQDGGIIVHYEPGPVWFVGTAYMKALERWHWMHHEYIYCNYNLFVLADFFRGVNRKPSSADLEKMAAEGLSMPVKKESFREKFCRMIYHSYRITFQGVLGMLVWALAEKLLN